MYQEGIKSDFTGDNFCLRPETIYGAGKKSIS
jgi:hypothetical protein